MADYLILWLFAGLFFWIIGYVLVYQLLKFMKWNIKIFIPKKHYFYGDEIEWNIEIHAKKHIEVTKTEVVLVAYRRERTYTNKGTKTRNVEIFRQETEISWKDTLLAGTKRSKNISIEIPKIENLPKEMQLMIDHPNKLLAKTQSFYRWLTRSSKLKWHMRVNVVAEGIDLYKRESLELKAPIHGDNI